MTISLLLFTHMYSMPAIVIPGLWGSNQDLPNSWSPYHLVDVVPVHNTVRTGHFFHLTHHVPRHALQLICARALALITPTMVANLQCKQHNKDCPLNSGYTVATLVYSRGQNKVNIHSTYNDRATVIAVNQNAKINEK